MITGKERSARKKYTGSLVTFQDDCREKGSKVKIKGTGLTMSSINTISDDDNDESTMTDPHHHHHHHHRHHHDENDCKVVDDDGEEQWLIITSTTTIINITSTIMMSMQ